MLRIFACIFLSRSKFYRMKQFVFLLTFVFYEIRLNGKQCVHCSCSNDYSSCFLFLLFWNVFVSFDYNWMFNAPLRQKRTSIHTSPSSYHLHYQFTSSDKHLWKLKAVAISTGKKETPTWAPRNDVDKLSV